MTYRQLIEMLSGLPESYLDQDVCYQAFEERYVVNALRLSHFSYEYRVNDPNVPAISALLMAFD